MALFLRKFFSPIGGSVQSQRSATFVLSGPSGCGKEVTLKAARLIRPDIRVPVSTTSRPPRDGEVDGVHYHFVELSEFMSLKDRGMFAECAEVHGRWYGTSYQSLQAAQEVPGIVILEIDVQGARAIKELYPEVQIIFLLPPSRDELETRLRLRATETESVIQTRLSNAPGEIQEAQNFDWWIVNRTVDQAAADLLRLIGLLTEKKTILHDEYRCSAVYDRVLRTFSELRTPPSL